MSETLGIIGAMDVEVATLIEALETPETHKIGDRVYYSGRLGDSHVVVVQCGIGKVCAAMCAQTLVDRFHVDGIVNTGVAGGVGDGLAVGDLVVADGAVQHDFDITAFGHVRGYIPAMGNRDGRPSVWPTDAALSARFRAAAAAVQAQEGDFSCHGGCVATGDVFVSSPELKRMLRETFEAVAAEMEGGAVAQVAYLNGVPFALVRAISDLADGSGAASYEEFEEAAARRSARILLTMLHAAE